MCQELYRALNLCRHSCSCNPENFDLVICEATFGNIVRGEGSSCWHLTCGEQDTPKHPLKPQGILPHQ